MQWQKILAQGFNSATELLEFLALSTSFRCKNAEKEFNTRVPLGFAKRMQRGNPKDPLLLQVLASRDELVQVEGYTHDPLLEAKVNPLPGLLHKYHGRVLVTLTGACAVNCRYCFRRHFPYHQNNPGRQGLSKIIGYIQKDSTIKEVILSGGEPLLVSDLLWQDLLNQFSTIKHLQTLRIHSRIPIVLPERINEPFLKRLEELDLNKVLVIHTNHPQEIDRSVLHACADLRRANCHLLSQSVLLRGVNDDVATLASLSERLFDCGVLPYYLHVLDKISGASHFDMPRELALSIHHKLQSLLPGYLVPRLVCEEDGQAHKTILK